jgi:predicted 3-demethylubiquinone-9 3-methyltransferase (glyoxalase superfamily)
LKNYFVFREKKAKNAVVNLLQMVWVSRARGVSYNIIQQNLNACMVKDQQNNIEKMLQHFSLLL